MSHSKNSVRDTAIAKRCICLGSERSMLHRVWAITEESAVAMERDVVSLWVIWAGWFHMLMSGSIIPTIREPLTPWLFRQCFGTILAPLGVSFNLQIEDQGLVEFDLSSWTNLILICLCYSLEPCHSFKSCALPSSLLVHALFLSQVLAHNVTFTIFLRENQKIAGPREGNTV